jgi:hypothetical protein
MFEAAVSAARTDGFEDVEVVIRPVQAMLVSFARFPRNGQEGW